MVEIGGSPMRITRRDRSSDDDERILAVEAGQVMCPRRGVLDVEYCFICSAYRGLRDGHIEGLVCTGTYESASLSQLMPRI
jgi:hypothetical protein